MNDYLFEYDYKGATWGITIRAETEHDARQRLWHASAKGEYMGQVAARMPALDGGALLRFWNWLRSK